MHLIQSLCGRPDRISDEIFRILRVKTVDYIGNLSTIHVVQENVHTVIKLVYRFRLDNEFTINILEKGIFLFDARFLLLCELLWGDLHDKLLIFIVFACSQVNLAFSVGVNYIFDHI